MRNKRERQIVQKKPKTLLFSLTAKDFDFQYFCVGGNGGQNVNAKQNGVRCIHIASGARAEHRDGRDQFRNKQEAFRKCAETPVFKVWHKIEVSKRLGTYIDIEKQIQEAVDKQMQDIYLKIETYDVEIED
jgi:peptide chain release factor-like protein